MGVRGLNSFMEKERKTRKVDIGREVVQWKRQNPNRKPVLVIDFDSLANWVVRWDQMGNICGGRHEKILKNWTNLLRNLKSTGCSLVFFRDLKTENSKLQKSLSRCNYIHNLSIKLYDLIDSGERLNNVSKKVAAGALTTAFYGMGLIANKFGQVFNSTKHECDFELAQYATNHKVMAVLSNDSDFLIFPGPWKLWSSEKLREKRDKNNSKRIIETIEYDRNALAKICSLSQHQLPLLATILGNDIMEKYNARLNEICIRFDRNEAKVKNAARIVQEIYETMDPDDIKQVTKRIFGQNISDQKELAIQQSLDSYNISIAQTIIVDPLEKRILNTNIYTQYMEMLESIIFISMPFYDMRGCVENSILPTLLIDLTKRKVGILCQQNKAYNFTIIAKKMLDENYNGFEETPIYPDFEVPTLERLYFGNIQEFKQIDNQRWRVLGWIMSLSMEMISNIRKLPKKFILICTTLYVLVKKGLISEQQADGIFHTESNIYSKEGVGKNMRLDVVMSNHIRAAHLYNIMFSQTRNCFIIAGLLSSIQDKMQFNGVYFQKLMENVDRPNTAAITPKNQFRIYANV